MASVQEILEQLEAHASAENLEGMARFGMTTEKRLGVPVPVMRQIAKATGKNHKLALGLWKTGIAEARIVASLIADPEALTEREMDRWVKDLNSWDVCDQVCMNLFDKSPFARAKIFEWSVREEEFVKRAAFALIASLAWHDKRASDESFIPFLELIKRGATDERNFVKKAVNWALRAIGKKSPRLNKAAVKTAREIQQLDSKSARWVAAGAIRELTSFGVFLLATAPRFTGMAIHEWLGISIGAAILILAALVVVGATVAFASTDYASSLVGVVGGRVEKGGPVIVENSSTSGTGDAPSGAVIDPQTQAANLAPRGEAEGSPVLNATDLLKNALTLSLIVAAVGFVTWLWDRMKPRRRDLVR